MAVNMMMKKLFVSLVLVSLILGCYTSNVLAKERVEIVLQTGHTDGVNSIAFSPDGRYIVSGSADKTVYLWEKDTGILTRRFEGHTETVTSVVFSPDGRYIASGSADKTVCLWEKDTGKLTRRFKGHTKVISAIAFSPDGRYIASGSGDKTVRLWDKDTGNLIRRFEGHTARVTSVAFSPDGRYIASGSRDKTVCLWEKDTSTLIRRFKRYTSGVTSVAFGPDGKYITSGSADKTICLWEKDTGKLIRTFEGHTGIVSSVAFSPDDRYIASGSADKTICLWEKDTGKLTRRFKGHTKVISAIAFSPDGRYIASGSGDKTVCLWDKDTGNLIRKLEGHTNGVISVAFSPDGRYITSGGWDEICLWDKDTGNLIRKLEGHTNGVISVAFSPDGRYIASGGWDKTICFWDKDTGTLIRRFEGHTGVVNSVAFSPDGRYIASGSEDKTVCLWDKDTGTLIRRFEGHTGVVNSVAFSPDGRYIASGSEDKTVCLWDKDTGKIIRRFKDHVWWGVIKTVAALKAGFICDNFYVGIWCVSGLSQIPYMEYWSSSGITSVAFSPDGKYIVSASGNCGETACLWEKDTGKLIRRFKESLWNKVLNLGFSGFLTSVAFSPDGRYIASGHYSGIWDYSICIWEKNTGNLIRRFEGHTNVVWSVTFSPDGRYITSGSTDGSLKIWNSETGQLLLTMIGFKDGEWVVYTPDNYYNSSPNGDKYVSFRVGDKVYSFDQYAAIYKRPEIIAKVLRGEDIKEAVAKIEAETGVEVSKVTIAQLPPPAVVIAQPWEEYTVVTEGCIKIKGKAKDEVFGIEWVKIIHQEKLIKEQKANGDKECKFEIEIPNIPKGDNRIKVIAQNTKRITDSEERVISYRKPETPIEIVKSCFGAESNWAVVIGIDEYQKFGKLSYSVKDAQAITNLLRDNFGFSKDRIITIPEESATKQRIERLLGDELKGTVTANDRVLVFFSGHGMTEECNGKKFGYLVPIDGDPGAIDSTCISMDQISRWSERSSAKHSLFIIDACYSGLAGIMRKGGSPEETKDQIRKLVERPGRQVITAGGKDEPVVQGEKWGGYSVFTYYLLKGLKGEADVNDNKVITIHELTAYLENKVTKDAEQTPQLRYLGEGEGQFIFYKEGTK